MASQTIDCYRQGAEICNGDAECKKKIIELLTELCMPTGLFPMEDIQEFGYNRADGFVWIIQKKNKNHTFKKTKRQVSYATEVTTFVETHKMKKMTRVKTKELMLWLSVVEMYFQTPSSDKLTFKTGTGLSDSFEAAAFELEKVR